MTKEERLQKVLARHGFGSRRTIEQWIQEQRIKVNGQLATLGMRVQAGDTILVDGKRLELDMAHAVTTEILLYHKQSGEVSTRKDEKERPTVFDTLPKQRHGRWVMVGRLDVNTCGLLLFTNDGALAARLMHPSYEVEREYAVRVIGDVDPEVIKRLRTGIVLEDGLARFDVVEPIGGAGLNRWYRVVLKEGRYREVRRLWIAVGVTVNRLIRVRYGNVVLPRDLRLGQHRLLDPTGVEALAALVDYTLPQISESSSIQKKTRPKRQRQERITPRQRPPLSKRFTK